MSSADRTLCLLLTAEYGTGGRFRGQSASRRELNAIGYSEPFRSSVNRTVPGFAQTARRSLRAKSDLYAVYSAFREESFNTPLQGLWGAVFGISTQKCRTKFFSDFQSGTVLNAGNICWEKRYRQNASTLKKNH